jgi:hypothetical protein
MDPTGRREFLRGVGQLGLAGGVGALLGQGTGCVPQNASPPPPSDGQGEQWPWTYAKLDVENVRKRGHQSFYKGDCCYGAFAGIMGALADQVGEPFASFPTDMMRYGKGGVFGYGSLCGALNGSSAAITLVSDEGTASKVVTELLNWYAATALPTDTSNQYAVNHEFLVEQLKTDEALDQNAAGDVLCHVSVTEWCKLSGYASGSEQRKERCARLTGDVAAKAVELLNAVKDQTFQPLLKSPGEKSGCMSCHTAGTNYAGGQWTQGKMNCTSCHVSPVLLEHQGHSW